MKKILPLCLIVLAACAKDFTYQNTTWGMSEKAVKSARGTDYEHTMINGLKATVKYGYTRRGLEKVTVVFDPVVVEKDKYVDYFHQIKALLTDKYRAPELEAADYVAKAESYRISAAPDYQSRSVFRTEMVQITLSCGGACDGTSTDNSITLLYEPPSTRSDAL
jgi:hypothetical protein